WGTRLGRMIDSSTRVAVTLAAHEEGFHADHRARRRGRPHHRTGRPLGREAAAGSPRDGASLLPRRARALPPAHLRHRHREPRRDVRGIRPIDMLQSMGLACAMGMPLERVFTSDESERFTILDAPSWARDGRERLAFNTENNVGRAVLFPTFM